MLKQFLYVIMFLRIFSLNQKIKCVPGLGNYQKLQEKNSDNVFPWTGAKYGGIAHIAYIIQIYMNLYRYCRLLIDK